MICYANNIGVWLRVSKVRDQLDREKLGRNAGTAL